MASSVYTYSEYLQKQFGAKTYKIVVASGLTCPTRDGTIAKRGCAFCDIRGSSSFHGKQGRSQEIHKQIDSRIGPIKKRFGSEKFLAYFQSYTNTYSDIDYLRGIYTDALSHPEISGLAIGTRPDCLPDPVLHLLNELSEKYYISLELGVQSLHNPTLEWLVRGHTAECSLEAIDRTTRLAPKVQLGIHLMFGNPTDLIDTPKTTALLLSSKKIHGVKLHQLMVLKNTDLEKRYLDEPFKTADLQEYTQIASEFVSHLRPDIYIERLYATATHPEELLAPKWSAERWSTHNHLRDFFNIKNINQGSLVK